MKKPNLPKLKINIGKKSVFLFDKRAKQCYFYRNTNVNFYRGVICYEKNPHFLAGYPLPLPFLLPAEVYFWHHLSKLQFQNQSLILLLLS